MGLSTLWQDNLVKLLLQLSGAPAGLPDPYIGVYTDLPTPDGGYLGIQPATADGYTGPVHVAGDTFWTFAGSATGTATSNVIGLGTPTVDWGPIIGWALIQSDGTIISEPVEFDDPISFDVGVAAQLLADQLGLAVT